MIIGDRLRELREAKNLSQEDIEKRTGLLRCYISRVENGHTVPAIETLAGSCCTDLEWRWRKVPNMGTSRQRGSIFSEVDEVCSTDEPR